MYAQWRIKGTPCPKIGGTDVGLEPEKCGGCRFYRGGSHGPGPDNPLKILCNWPHDGSYVEQSVFDTEFWVNALEDIPDA